MKKIIYFCLLLPFLLASGKAGAQSLAIAAASPSQCFVQGAGAYNNVTFSVTATPTTATSYSWAVTSGTFLCASISGSTAANGSLATLSYSCCDDYTITCSAYNGTTVISSATYPYSSVCGAYPYVISSSPNPVCPGGSVVMTATCNVNTFTWTSISGTIASTNSVTSVPQVFGSTVVITPSVSSCYTVTSINNTCPGATTACITVVTLPVVTATSPTYICSGATGILSASGASSYLWSSSTGTMATSATVAISPTANDCYTVVGSNASGCTGSAVTCVTVTPTPTLVISGNPVICNGSAGTLTASGSAGSYTWNTGVVASSISFSTAGCYSVSSDYGGCYGNASACTTVQPTPTITATGPASLCSYAFDVLTLSGATTYTVASPTGTYASGSTFPINPGVTTQYTITGSNGSCSSTTFVTVNVISSPALTLSGSTVVCSGSSETITASGATNYTWDTGSSTSSIVVLNTVSTSSVFVYNVIGTDLNGCSDTATFYLYVNSNCNMVWPGDANSDGVVDNTDVFEIGLAYNSTGAARTPTSNVYAAQYSNTWGALTVSTGKNLCNADCNGDGTINNDDTLAIYNNYLLPHAFRPSNTTNANPDIQVMPPANMNDNAWYSAPILLGDATNQISQLYGIAFDLYFDKTMIDLNEAYIVYTPSFLNATDNNVEFKKLDFNNGVIHAASVRIDHANVSGNGKIGDFFFHLKPNLPAMSNLNISVSNVSRIDKAGVAASLTGNTATSTVNGATGVREIPALQNSISCYPNPASDLLVLQNNSSSKVEYHIFDILGKAVAHGDFTNSKTLDISKYEKGTYIIRFESGFDRFHKKLIIEK